MNEVLQPVTDPMAVLHGELSGVNLLDVALVDRAYRRIVATSDSAEVRVAWLANHTLDPVVRVAAVAAFQQGVHVAGWVAPFGQHFQAILDEHSELHSFRPNVLVLWLSLRQLAPSLVEAGDILDGPARQAQADAVLSQIAEWLQVARERTEATLIVANFPRPAISRLSLADLRVESGEALLFDNLNFRLAAAYRDDPRVIILDVAHAVASGGSRRGWNARMYRLAKIEWMDAAAVSAGVLFARAFRALVRPAKKCLAVDLDNTLWGGVIGEDGPGGIRIAEGDPVGEAYRAFQFALLDLKARGVLLALCSKNNIEDVAEGFATRSMPLTLADFSAVRVNWNSKPDNLKEIASELNIGLDSLVFMDDSPAECELVRHFAPAVTTVHLPPDPARYADLVFDTWDFDKLTITAEDVRKTEQYRENAARAASMSQIKDLSAFLENLGTRIRIKRANKDSLARLHQLFGKTNQFNVTTKRYTPAEVEAFASSTEWRLEYVEARDNFGDLGIIALFLLRLDPALPQVDSLLLSCRAMGRGIETAMCNRIKQIAFGELHAAELSAYFEVTRKNKPAAGFFESQGFDMVGSDDGGTQMYCLTRERSCVQPCPGLVAVEMEG